jgi:hypothetical protein
MKGRLLGVWVVALLTLALVAAPATAQQIGPDGGAQVDEYAGIQEEAQGGGAGPGGGPGVEGGGNVGSGGGQLPFTGLAVLPLILLGTALLFAGPALRRWRAQRSMPPAAS